MSISTTGGVVERASKEFSRRMHSLGFKTSSSPAPTATPSPNSQTATSTSTFVIAATTLTTSVAPSTTTTTGAGKERGPPPPPPPRSNKPTTSKPQIELSEDDKLNGNNDPGDLQVQQPPVASTAPAASTSASKTNETSIKVQMRAKPVCPAAKQPMARASMGSIIRGSVMEKVTNVFNNGVSSMGNSSSNSATFPSGTSKSQVEGTKSNSENEPSEKDLAVTASTKDGKNVPSPGSGINIPKGIVCYWSFSPPAAEYALWR